ncbi:MAG: CoA-binding protein [Planctomycetota bacterium]
MRVMVIGASTHAEKYGHRAVRAYLAQGHDVFPVHPTADEILGLPAFATIAAVPGPIDRATLYVPADIGLTLVDDLAARGDVDEVWLNPGSESPELVAALTERGLAPIQACSIIDIGAMP